MYCPKCGNELPDNAKFCNMCGNEITIRPGQKKKANQADSVNTSKNDTDNPDINYHGIDNNKNTGTFSNRNKDTRDFGDKYKGKEIKSRDAYEKEKERNREKDRWNHTDDRDRRDPNNIGNDIKKINYEDPEPPKNGWMKVLVIVLATILIVAAIVVALLYFKPWERFTGGDSDTETEYHSTRAESTTKATTEATTESTTEPPTTATTEATTQATTEPPTIATTETIETEESRLRYVDNTSCAIEKNLSTDAFEYCYCEDGDYSFMYPKYVFNRVKYNPETCGYYFSYVDDYGNRLCAMNVYREEKTSTDAVKTAKSFRNRFDSYYYEANYWWPSKDLKKLTSDQDSSYKEPRADGYARYIMSGWTDRSKDESLYTLGANNGKYSYFLEFYYPEDDVNSDMENWDYVIECVYRKLSFGGSNFDMRSWDLFKSEGYGEGHH